MKILLVSYHFYDYAAEGLVAAKAARALADRGHQVDVVSAGFNWSEKEPQAGWAEQLEGIAIHKVSGDESLVPAWWQQLNRFGQGNWLTQKLAAFGGLRYACNPAEYAWVVSAHRKAAELIRSDGPPDVLLTRLNPLQCHLVGLRLVKEFRGLPWCAYFSDPWPFHLYPDPYNFTVGPVSRVRLEHLLQTILRRAGSVLFPSARLRDHLLTGKRARFLGKTFIAPHLGTFSRPPSAHDRTETLRLRHTGLLMKQRRIEPLLDGLRLLFQRVPGARGRIRIEFTGNTYITNISKGDDPSSQTPQDLRDTVSFEPYKFPGDAWRWLLDADVFLLVEAKLKEGIFMPSKLADYLIGGRPILALSPANGTVADYLKEGGGLVAEPDDVEGIATALCQLYNGWKNGTLDRLAPSREQARRVSPECVVPIYEAAFAYAAQQA